jgi:hypothetical protein
MWRNVAMQKWLRGIHAPSSRDRGVFLKNDRISYINREILKVR